MTHIISCLDQSYSEWVVKPSLPFWRALGATPASLTVLGLLSSIGAVYSLHKKQNITSGLFLLLRIYFDYADDHLAEAYHLETPFGDTYDNAIDCILFFVFLFILWKQNRRRLAMLLLVLGVVVKKAMKKSRIMEQRKT